MGWILDNWEGIGAVVALVLSAFGVRTARRADRKASGR